MPIISWIWNSFRTIIHFSWNYFFIHLPNFSWFFIIFNQFLISPGICNSNFKWLHISSTTSNWIWINCLFVPGFLIYFVQLLIFHKIRNYFLFIHQIPPDFIINFEPHVNFTWNLYNQLINQFEIHNPNSK